MFGYCPSVCRYGSFVSTFLPRYWIGRGKTLFANFLSLPVVSRTPSGDKIRNNDAQTFQGPSQCEFSYTEIQKNNYNSHLSFRFHPIHRPQQGRRQQGQHIAHPRREGKIGSENHRPCVCFIQLLLTFYFVSALLLSFVGAPQVKPTSDEKVALSSCGDVASENDDDDMEQEEMFVEAHASFGHNKVEWGGPRRGGRFPEPTRFGDWERKGRCTDF